MLSWENPDNFQVLAQKKKFFKVYFNFLAMSEKTQAARVLHLQGSQVTKQNTQAFTSK